MEQFPRCLSGSTENGASGKTKGSTVRLVTTLKT